MARCNLAGFVLPVLLLVSFAQALAIDARSPKPRQDIRFDYSCEPYLDVIDQAIIATRNLATAGYKAAKDPTNPIFQRYFGSENESEVQRTFRNIRSVLKGQKGPLTIACRENGFCLDDDAAYGYANFVPGSLKDSYINLCQHVFIGGPQSLEIRNDYCSGTAQASISSTLLHEMIHMPGIGPPDVRIHDEYYDVLDCMKIASGRAKDSTGALVLPHTNPDSYVFLAETTLWTTYKNNPTKCPSNSNSELRRLLGMNTTSVANVTFLMSDPVINVTALQLDDIWVPSRNDTNLDLGPYDQQLNSNATSYLVPSNATNG